MTLEQAHAAPTALPPGRAGWRWAVLGAHGGAGTSTVVALLDPDAAGVPVDGSDRASLSAGVTPVLVARSTAHGMNRAAQWLASMPTQGFPAPWLVVVADAPAGWPLAVRYRVTAVGERIRGVARVPWLWPLRNCDDPREALQHRAVAQVGRALRRNLEQEKGKR